MRKNGLCFWLIWISIVLFLNTGCHRNDTIKIGFVGGLSGTMSELGVTGRNGAILAVEEINEAGGIKGKKIELLIKDDENNSDKGLQAVQELHKEGAVAIIGHFTSGANLKSFDYINQNKIIMISPTVSTTLFSDKDDYYFRVIAGNRHQGESLAVAAVERNVKKMAVLYEERNKAYSYEIYQYFKNKFESLGGKIVYLKSFLSVPNLGFEKYVKEILNSGAEAILSIASGFDTAMLCQQIQKQGSSIKVFGPMWASTHDLIQYGGKAVERMVLVSEYSIQEEEKPEYLSFTRKYKSRYQVKHGFGAVYSYEAVMALAQALKEAGNFEVETIRSQLLKIQQIRGLQNNYSFNHYGDTVRPIYIYKIQNGKMIEDK